MQLLTREYAWSKRVILLRAGEYLVHSIYVNGVAEDLGSASIDDARQPADDGNTVYVDDIQFGLPKGLQRMSCLVSTLCWSEASAETTYRCSDVHGGKFADIVVLVNGTEGELSTGSIEFESKYR